MAVHCSLTAFVESEFLAKKFVSSFIHEKCITNYKLKQYEQTVDFIGWPCEGCLHTVQQMNIVEAVHERVYRNLLRKQKHMAKEMNVPDQATSGIIHENLHMGDYQL